MKQNDGEGRGVWGGGEWWSLQRVELVGDVMEMNDRRYHEDIYELDSEP